MIMQSKPAAPWRRRILAVMAAASMALAGFAGGASPAHAAPPLPTGLTNPLSAANRLGPLESLTVDGNGAANSVTTSAAFPTATATDGIRFIATNGDGSGATIAWGNVKSFSAAGYDPAKKVVRSGTSAQAFFANVIQPWVDGRQIVVYVILAPGGTTSFSNPGVDDPSNATAPYFSSTLVYSAATKTWSVKPEAPTPVNTQTVLAASNVTDTTATVTATVTPADATGQVLFTNTATGQSLGSAPVSGGVATLNLTGLTGNTPYTITGQYQGDSTHNASGGEVAFTTNPTVVDQKSKVVTARVPDAKAAKPGTGTLQITVASSASNLTGGARTIGQPWQATGALHKVTVQDDRRNPSAPTWTLSGQASDFAVQGTTIPASALGWTPKAITDGVSVGPAASDLSQPQILASGQGTSDSYFKSSVDADLALVVPGDKPGGNYQSTITLVLI